MNKNLSELLESRKNICILRNKGGLGDILMHRMIFEDIKKSFDGCNLTFACPKEYHPAVDDHPFVDRVITPEEINEKKYIAIYDTTHSCYRYENLMAPNINKHRSDIWAEKSCGISLSNHNMYISVESKFAEEVSQIFNNRKNILFSPISAMGSKSLNENQYKPVEEKLKELGFNVWYLHTKQISENMIKPGIKRFLAAISLCDMVLTVDTAAFHAAGGMGKPCVSIFGWTDGKVYSKYYKNCRIIQRHRDKIKDWCGPCFNFYKCPKVKCSDIRKPCITEITSEEILNNVLDFLKINNKL